jgi:hypothetical protein
MLGAMIVPFLGDLTWTAIASQTVSLHSSEFHPFKRLERFELLERLELYFAKAGLDNQPKNRIEGQKES